MMSPAAAAAYAMPGRLQERMSMLRYIAYSPSVANAASAGASNEKGKSSRYARSMTPGAIARKHSRADELRRKAFAERVDKARVASERGEAVRARKKEMEADAAAAAAAASAVVEGVVADVVAGVVADEEAAVVVEEEEEEEEEEGGEEEQLVVEQQEEAAAVVVVAEQQEQQQEEEEAAAEDYAVEYMGNQAKLYNASGQRLQVASLPPHLAARLSALRAAGIGGTGAAAAADEAATAATAAAATAAKEQSKDGICTRRALEKTCRCLET